MTIKPNILIVEDSVMMQELYSSMLEDQYEIKFFSTIAGFFSYIESSDFIKPHIILVDNELEDGYLADEIINKYGEDGFKLFHEVPAIAVSGHEDDSYLGQVYSLGIKEYVRKPVTESVLAFKIGFYSKQATPYFLNPTERELRYKGKSVILTLKEMAIFVAIAEYQNSTIDRKLVCHKVFGMDVDCSERQFAACKNKLSVHLSSLRKKLSSIGMSIKNDNDVGEEASLSIEYTR